MKSQKTLKAAVSTWDESRVRKVLNGVSFSKEARKDLAPVSKEREKYITNIANKALALAKR